MWLVPFIVVCVLLGVAVTACAWQAVERRRLSQGLADSQSQNQSLTEQLHTFETKIAVAEQTQRHVEEQFDQAQKQLRDAFKSLAGDVLKQSNEQFLSLAKKTFEGEQKDAVMQLELRKKEIQGLVKPLKDGLLEYTRSIQEIEKDRKKDKGAMTAQIDLLGKETSSLVEVLRHSRVRGEWGQVQLRRIAELAGMQDHCDFYEQQSVQGPSGRLQPDMVVKLPNDRTIVIDAKTPWESYHKSLEVEEDDQRQQLLQRHADAVEGHVKQLAAKEYASQFSRSPNFVVLFVPTESILYAAVHARPELIESAMTKNIVIASPTILIALLKAVEMGWREESIAENAKKISELGIELHKRITTAFGHFDKLGTAIGSTVAHFNKLVGSLESSVLPQARRFKELGADSHKSLPEQLDQIDTIPRDIKPDIKIMPSPMPQANRSIE